MPLSRAVSSSPDRYRQRQEPGCSSPGCGALAARRSAREHQHLYMSPRRRVRRKPPHRAPCARPGIAGVLRPAQVPVQPQPAQILGHEQRVVCIAALGVEVFSRKSISPPSDLASSHASKLDAIFPRCSRPLGLGAKRPRIFLPIIHHR